MDRKPELVIAQGAGNACLRVRVKFICDLQTWQTFEYLQSAFLRGRVGKFYQNAFQHLSAKASKPPDGSFTDAQVAVRKGIQQQRCSLGSTGTQGNSRGAADR